MQKEIESIQHLERRRNNLSSVIEEGSALYKRREARGQDLKEQVGSSFDATLAYGRYSRGTGVVERVVEGLGDRFERLNREIDPVIEEQAKNYLNEVNLRRDQLAELSILTAEGHLAEDDLRRHQEQFEELVKLPGRNSLLQMGINRIRQEDESGGERKTNASQIGEQEDKLFEQAQSIEIERQTPLPKRVVEGLITSKARITMLRFFYNNPDEKFHVREIVRRTDMEINEVRRELVRLKESGILEKTSNKNRKYYGLTKDPSLHSLLSPFFYSGTSF